MGCTVRLVVAAGVLLGGMVRAGELPLEEVPSVEPAAPGVNQETPSRAKSKDPPPCVKDEPSAGEVVRAAWEESGLSPERDESRARRVRWAGWLPKLGGGLSKDLGDNWDYKYEPGTPRVDQLTQNDGLRWEVTLGLDLSRVAYDPEEVRVSREASRRMRERMDLAAEVVRLYYTRRRLTMKGLPSPGTKAASQLLETTSLLDAWTADRFHRRWCGVAP